jgi:hypothetical protein
MKMIVLCTIAAAVLAACGGGGGGGSSAPPPPPTSIQGFWSGRVDASLSTSAVILDNGDVWLVFQATDAVGTPVSITGMARAAMTVTGSSYTGAGSNYDLTANPPSNISLAGTATAKTSLVGSYTTGGATKNVRLAYNASYETPANLADVTGHWTGTFGSSASSLGLDVAATGSLTGSSTTGCSYTGTLIPHAGNVAVFDLALTETCLGTAVILQGITTINAAKTLLFLAFTTVDKSRGGLFVGQKGSLG